MAANVVPLFDGATAALAFDMAWYSVAIMGFWVGCYVLSAYIRLHDQKDKSVIKNPTMAQRFEAADVIFALPFYVLIFVFSMKATYELYGDVTSRWHGTTFSSQQFQLLYVVRMTTHIPIQWVVLASNPSLRLQMTGHHVLSAVAYGGGLITARCHFWACLDGCCEFSTIFLNLVFAFKWLAPEKQSGLLFQASGMLLWIGFVVFRLTLFPAWLWFFYVDARDNPSQSWDRVSMFEQYFYALVTLFLLVMSCIWFIPITKGMLKGLGLIGAKKARKE